MPTNNCLTCGSEFDVIPSRQDAKFCSTECYHKGQKQGLTDHSDRRVEYVELECTGCDKEMEKPPSRAKRSERQFCSQECYLDWNKSHQKKQTGRRKRMREKSSESCKICEFDRFLEICHIVPSKDGGTFHKDNILFLCPNHHRLFDHGGMNKKEFSKIEIELRKAICENKGWQEPK